MANGAVNDGEHRRPVVTSAGDLAQSGYEACEVWRDPVVGFHGCGSVDQANAVS